MAHIDLSHVYAKAEYNGSMGIDRSLGAFGGGLSLVSDMRVSSDRTLKKRFGFAFKGALPAPVRALYKLSEALLLVLAGNSLYSVSPDSGSFTKLDQVGSAEGEAAFLSYRGILLLLDGQEVYSYSSGALSPVSGYVPLYGNGWHPGAMGAVYEPLNMASNRVRVTFYTGGSSPDEFYFPFLLTSVDAVFVNGEKKNEQVYVIMDDGKHLHTNYPPDPNSTVEFFLTLDSATVGRQTMAACKSGAVYGDSTLGDGKLSGVFYHGSDPSRLFPIRPVSESELARARQVYPLISEIYLPAEDAMPVNGGQSDVTATCRREDGLMVFTRDMAYMLSRSPEGDNRLSAIASGMGCVSERGAALWKDSPITVNERGIYKWSPVPGDVIEYVAQCISLPLGDIFDGYYQSAEVCPYRSMGEIWFMSPLDPDGRVFIYEPDAKVWYCYSGLSPEITFEHGGQMGFFSGGDMFLFSPQLDYDILKNGVQAIQARIEGEGLFSEPCNKKKRLSRVIIRGTAGAAFTLTVTDADGERYVFPLSDTEGETRGYIEARLNAGRSRYYSFSLQCETPSAELYRLILTAVD